MAKEKKILDKKGCVNSFALVGEARINDNTFKLDCHSEKSDWLYNQMYMNVYCGDAFGNVPCESMGGYGLNRQNVIYCHGIDEDGKENFNDRIIVDWDDRLNEEVIKSVGSSVYLTASLEKMDTGRYYRKPFLHAYDFIKYIHDHIENGTQVVVTGKLKYSEYNGNVRVQKEITNIRKFTEEEKDKYNNGELKYFAQFKQSVLVNTDSVLEVDEKKGVAQVQAIVLEYFKKYNGYDVSGIVPLKKMMEYKFNPDKTNWKDIQKLLFSQKRGYDEIKFSGVFNESGSVVQISEEDLSDDVKMLINMGVYTLEDVLKEAAGNEQKISKMVLTKPLTKNDNGAIHLDITQKKYDEEDLQLDCLIKREDEEDDEETEFTDIDDESLDAIFKDMDY